MAKNTTAKSSANAQDKPAAQSEKTENEVTAKFSGGVLAAAEFCGIDAEEVLSYRATGNRFIVVTRSGQKLTESAEERDERLENEKRIAKRREEFAEFQKEMQGLDAQPG
ncbi:MAG: hypothetical protein DHS20C12_11900 [Pseudohongiella sp.]|nr:MAG: hypothetical protein DHS20C12_11900 [Pseudohongiella sp.]